MEYLKTIALIIASVANICTICNMGSSFLQLSVLKGQKKVQELESLDSMWFKRFPNEHLSILHFHTDIPHDYFHYISCLV